MKNNNVVKRRSLAVIKLQAAKLEREEVVNRGCRGDGLWRRDGLELLWVRKVKSLASSSISKGQVPAEGPPKFRSEVATQGETLTPSWHPPHERRRWVETRLVAASRWAGRQPRGGEEGRERGLEARRAPHSKFIGTKSPSAQAWFLLEITGNWRHQQLLFRPPR